MKRSHLCLIGSMATVLVMAGWSASSAQQSTGGTPPSVTEGLPGQKSFGAGGQKGQSTEKSMVPSQHEPSGKTEPGDRMIEGSKPFGGTAGSSRGSGSRGSGTSSGSGTGSGASGMGSGSSGAMGSGGGSGR
ncbi:MAG: hypothetical protein JSR62_01415 [Nitrospira sp.]|nr:hypothetical protein [Nitrospira sp.]